MKSGLPSLTVYRKIHSTTITSPLTTLSNTTVKTARPLQWRESTFPPTAERLTGSVLGIACIKGGFAVVGQSKSSTEDFQGYKVGGGSDGYILYLNDEGKTTATVRLNGAQDDSAMDVAVLSDGSIAIAGWTKSDDQAFNGSNAKKQYMGYVSRYTATMK